MFQDDSQTYLKLLENLKTPPFHKLIVLFLSLKSLPKLPITLAFIWSQFQLLTLFARAIILSLFDRRMAFSISPVHFIEKYLFSRNLFDSANSPELTLGMLILTLIYFIIPILTLAYILFAFNRKFMIPNAVLKSWKYFMDIHILVVFYPLHLNSTHLILNITMGQLLLDFIKIFSYIVLIVNLILTLALTVLFYAPVKTRHPFSAKTNALNILDLLLKIFLPFFLSKNSLQTGEKVLLMIIISLYCLLRDNILLRIFPYYRLWALKVAGIAHAVISSLVLASLFAKLFCKAHDDWNQYSVTVLLYVVFGPIFIKMYTSYIRNKLIRIGLHPEEVNNAYHILQYWEIFKNFMEFENTGLAGSRISREYFDFIRMTGFQFNISSSENNREALNSQKKAFFEKNLALFKNFTTRYPKDSWLVELAIARLYTKQETLCILASHIINKRTNKNFFDKISLSLLKLKILNKLQSHRNISEDQIQIAAFIHMQNQYKKLRKSMINSVEIHLKFWKMFSSHKPNFLKMIQCAKQNIISTNKLRFISNQAKDFRQSLFAEPLLACSIYCYFFQDDTLLAGNLLKEYFLTQKRLKDLSDKSKANSEDLKFSADAVYLIVSAEQNKLGEILDCSGHVGSTFSCPKEFLIGRPINVLIPPFYAKYHDSFLKAGRQESVSAILDKTRQVPVLAEGGFLKTGLIHVSLTYLSDHELCYYVIIEAVKDDDTRLVLVNPNGAISSCSENFAVDLGFNEYKDQEQLNIELLCPNFFQEISGGTTSDNSLLSPDHREITETKEIQQLPFFPFWYAKDKETLSRLNPIIYQATMRRLKVQNSEIYELKMQKISTFNFTLPKHYAFPKSVKEILLQSSRIDHHQTEVPLSPKSSDRPLALSSKRRFFNTLRTYEVPVSLTNSTTHQQLISSPQAEKNFEFNMNTNTSMLRFGTAESPKLKPVFTQINGDEDSFNQPENEEEDEISIVQEITSNNNHKKQIIDPLADLDKDVRENIIQDLFKASSTNTDVSRLESTKSIERQKIVKRLVQARTRRTETKFYIGSFGIVCLLLLTLLIWLNFHTANTSHDVKVYSDVLQNSYFRSYWATIANQDTLYWLGRIINWVDWDIDELYEAFYESFGKFNEYNELLEQSISFISPELQKMHYKRKVPIFERDADFEKYYVHTDDTFQASKRIINRGMMNYNRGINGYDFQEAIHQDSYFILDNSLNDLQIQASLLIDAVTETLFGIFETSRHTMLLYIGITFGIVFLFMIFSLKYIITTNLEFKRFMTILYMLRKPDIKHIETVSLTFRDLLEKDSQEKDLYFNLYDSEKLRANAQKIHLQEINTQKRQKDFYFNINHSSSLKGVYQRNFLLFLGLFIFTGLIVGFTLIYFSQSANKLDTMRKQQVNINTALLFVNSLSWASTELLIVSVFNFTMPTRNRPIIESFLLDIDQIKDVDTLQASLRNVDDEYSPSMEIILFNFPCEDSYSPYYNYPKEALVEECQAISNGVNVVGLIEIMTRIGMILGNDIPAFYSGERDEDDLMDFYTGIYDLYGPLTDTGFVLLLSAYVAALDEFDELVLDLEMLQVRLAWLAAVFSFLLGIFTWVFIMRKISKLDFESREVLSFVPTRLLLKSSQLKRYVVSTAKADDTIAQSLLR